MVTSKCQFHSYIGIITQLLQENNHIFFCEKGKSVIKWRKGGDPMKKVKITAMRRTTYPDLMQLYENPIEHACEVQLGQVWISSDGQKPEGFCNAAWESMSEFVKELALGGGNFYDGWMKNPYSAMISCNDGFRPVSYYLEVINDD